MEMGVLGKKIFFLYPPPVLTEIAEELARREFEVYMARNHDKMLRVLVQSPGSIVFINLDEGLDEEDWGSWVLKLKNDPATASIGVGVITLNDNPAAREKFLMDLQVPCGFIILKIGSAKTTEILTKTLSANEARGRRKFVRANCPPGAGLCVVEHDGSKLKASLTDLSCGGVALKFEVDTGLQTGTVLRGMSLAVKGVRIIATGFVAAHRTDSDGSKVHVVMFAPGSLDDTRREKIHSLILRINQATMDRLLEAV
jgi:hypothetical protein